MRVIRINRSAHVWENDATCLEEACEVLGFATDLTSVTNDGKALSYFVDVTWNMVRDAGNTSRLRDRA